jgi:hypothetical protein
MVEKISKASLPGFVEVDRAAARTDAFLPHAQVDEIKTPQDLNQYSQTQNAKGDLVSNPHIGLLCDLRAFPLGR